MIEQNPSTQEYLISVKKAVSQSQSMIDLGLNALKNLSTIISFLKVEEMYKMVLENDNKRAKSPKKSKETLLEVDDDFNEALNEQIIEYRDMKSESKINTKDGMDTIEVKREYNASK